ncbi:MAG: thiamine phosphate synthase [Deltaproteobacteria bacterium]|nr:thiamine phosphate synthase [Deltaproteobacteria bacterium]
MINFNCYLITDRHQTGGRSLTAVIEEALKSGIKAVQLREKDLNANELFELAQSMKKLTSQYGAKLFINDRIDIAIAVEAYGVHLGQKSFSPENVREVLNSSQLTVHDSRLLIGVSTHSLKEAKKAEQDGADFITIGPLFYTPSKARYGEPLGVDIIKRVKAGIKIPVFAIGGIKKNNIKDAMDADADGVALISAIISANEPSKAAREIIQELETRKEERGKRNTNS